MVPEKFDHKVSDQQVLRSGHKLTIGTAGVIPQAIFACSPNGQGDCHVSAFFHHQFRRLEPRLLLQFGQDFSSVDAKELLDLFQSVRLTDDHAGIHRSHFTFAFAGCFATSDDFSLSYWSRVMIWRDTSSA